MVHIYRENQLDELVCRTKGGWSTGGGDRQSYNLRPAGVMRKLREEMDYRAKASSQMRELGFGTVELTTEALTEYEFDDSARGWRRSLEAWHMLMSAWGVKLPHGALVRGLTKAGRPQPPHRPHSTTIQNADAVRDELARAGPPFDTWYRREESRTTPVSEAVKAAAGSPLSLGAKGDAHESLGHEPFPRLGQPRDRKPDPLAPAASHYVPAGSKASREGARQAAVDRMSAAREAAEKARQRSAAAAQTQARAAASPKGDAAAADSHLVAGSAKDAAAAPARSHSFSNASRNVAHARNTTIARQAPRNCYSIKAVVFNAWCASSCALNNCPPDMCKCDDISADEESKSNGPGSLQP